MEKNLAEKEKGSAEAAAAEAYPGAHVIGALSAAYRDAMARAVPGDEAAAAVAAAYRDAVARAVPGAEAAAAYRDAEAHREAIAAAAGKPMAIVLSQEPIIISGLREAQILSVKLAPGARRVKVASVAAKDAAALLIHLDRQTERLGWVVCREDARALEALSVAFLYSGTGIAAHLPVVSEKLESSDKVGYLLALKDWSMVLEDAAGCVPSVGGFKFYKQAKMVSRLARKVVAGGLNGARDLAWLRRRLDRMGELLPLLMKCTVEFPVTSEKMRAKALTRRIKEDKRRTKAEALVAAAVQKPAAEALLPSSVHLLPSASPNEICGLRSAHTLSLSLVPGSTVKVQAIKPMDALALDLLLRSVPWVVSEGDLHRVSNIGAAYLLLGTALGAHLSIFSSLSREDLCENTGYAIAFNEWVQEFESRAVAVRLTKFSQRAAEVCTGARQLLAEVCSCSRSEDWFANQVALLKKTVKAMMTSEVQFLLAE